jgi:glycosyltransferase involved in cell wall biosynthesis
MKICFFGIYNPSYNRNKVLMEGFRKNEIFVSACNSRRKSLMKYFDLMRMYARSCSDCDVVLVGYPGQSVMFFLGFFILYLRFAKKKLIVFDAFFSVYDQAVNDYKKTGFLGSWGAYLFLQDWLSCRLADVVMLDTEANINYFINCFKIKRKKFLKVPVGTTIQNEIGEAASGNPEAFLVHFHGKYIPLQGVEHILSAADLLKDSGIRFNIIGTNTKLEHGNRATANILFIDDVSYAKLKAYIDSADICLGIFGDTGKADRVIPNKIYEAIACGKAVITRRSTAIFEEFTDRKDCLMCEASNPRDIAEKILMLKNDPGLRETIANNGYDLFREHFSPETIIRRMAEDLKKIHGILR